MFVQLFKDALNEYAYSADLAGLKWELSNNKYGLSVSTSCPCFICDFWIDRIKLLCFAAGRNRLRPQVERVIGENSGKNGVVHHWWQEIWNIEGERKSTLF